MVGAVAASAAEEEAGAESAAPGPTNVEPGREFLRQAEDASSELVDFFSRVAKVMQPALHGNRRVLAEALINLRPAPEVLQNIVQQTSQGSSWMDVTEESNVRWAVHGGGEEEPRGEVTLCKGDSFPVVKVSLYGVIVLKLVMAACEEVLAGLPGQEQRRGYEAASRQLNRKLANEEHSARVLLTSSGQKAWKLDLHPANAFGHYGGARKRLSGQQETTGVALGRANRARLWPR